MNLMDLSKDRAEREFKIFFKDKYTLVEGIVKESLTSLFDILHSKEEIVFSTSEELEESINNLLVKKSQKFNFKVCENLRRNYTDFYKTLFVDFALRTAGGGSGFSDGKLSKYHFSIVSPDYIDDDFDRSDYDLSSYIDYRIGIYGNLDKCNKLHDVDDMTPQKVKEQLGLINTISDNLYVSVIRTNINLIKPYSSKQEALSLLNVDISSDLIKELSIEEMRTNTFRNEIFNIILNKTLLSIYTNLVYFSIISCYDQFRNVLLNNTKHITYFDIYMNLIANLLSSNSVNNKFDIIVNNPETTLTTLLDSIRLSFINETSFNIINRGVDQLRRFSVQRYFKYPIYIDRLLDKFLEYFRNKMAQIIINKRGLPQGTDTFYAIPKGFALESSCEKFNMRSNPVLRNNNGFSEFEFYGVESIKETEYYDKIRRMKRIDLMGKLKYQERNKLLKLEAEIARVKADVINCESTMLQKSLLKRLSVIGRDISDIMSKPSNSEDFNELLNMTEAERRDIEISLSNRDFNRERKTQLYGQLKTNNEFNY